MNNHFTFINGNFVPFGQSTLHVSDLSIQRGYAVFDFFLVRNGVPPYLTFHMERLMKSVSLLNLEIPYSQKELSSIVLDLIKKNNHGNSSVKIIVTGGLSVDDFTLSSSSVIIINKPFEVPITDATTNGGVLMTARYQRDMPEAKTINYIRSVRLSRQLIDSNAVEVLFLDRNWVRECSRSNIFMVKDKVVFTPKSKILKGVTKRRILSLEGFEVKEKDFKFNDLLDADEVFISSTTKGVMPIKGIDSTVIANGLVGPVTKAIQTIIMNGN
jgi:branched-subunit amino acid aminotransferase/4-amino-4-deoxychorismate lyase